MLKDMTGVLLAAGLGTRLGGLTADLPKPLLAVNGKSLLERAINWLKYLGVKKIVVVGGYKIDLVKDMVQKIDPRIKVVENPDYSTTQRMASLLKAMPEIEGDLLVQDADYVYHKKIADMAQAADYPCLTVHATKTPSAYCAQDVIAKTDQELNLLELVKTPGTQPLQEGEYYFNSLVYIPAKVQPGFFSLAQELLSHRENLMLHLEDVILRYAKNGGTVKVKDLGEPLWVEVDNPEELKAAEKFVREQADGVL